MFSFYAPWKQQKTGGFLMFSEGIEVEHWLKWVKVDPELWERTIILDSKWPIYLNQVFFFEEPLI